MVVYVADLYIMLKSTTTPIGQWFMEFKEYPTNEEVYNLIMEKHPIIKKFEYIEKPRLASAFDMDVTGIRFWVSRNAVNEEAVMIANNVRKIHTKNKEKYLL